jgi:carbon monoxide dehydrogenase subunit G
VLLENSFEVPAEIDRVWAYLLDVESVVVCMPGAEITEAVDERSWKGKVMVKLGPVSLSFAGKVDMAERDDDAHRVVLKGSGMEQRGKGRAAATITTTAEQTSDGTRVNVVQDLQIQGQVASMSRGMMKDVTAKLTKQFAECLETNLRAGEEPSREPTPAAAREARAAGEQVASPTPGVPGPPARSGEVKGFSLLLGALAGAVRRLFDRLFRRSSGG